jgi:caffeoyl-CoA O-methyltransferase
MDDAVESYLTELARAEHEEPVLVEMEARAAEHGFPIVGRATGRFLELAARAVGARRVIELGSGYGYSAYWFARAVGPDGEVICTDGDPENAKLAEDYPSTAGMWDRVGDALQGSASVACGCVTTRSGAGTSQPQPTRGPGWRYRLHPGT